MIVFGLDLGFRNTGVAVIEMRADGDFLTHADTLESISDKLRYKALEDVSANMSTLQQLDAMIRQHKPKAIFAEIPCGGGRNSRAVQCMSMSAAMLGAVTHYHNLSYEFMIPVESDKLLGINIRQGEAAGMKSGERQKWKKSRLKLLALHNFPGFEGWPDTIGRAEHTYDAACAFVAGRVKGDLYKALKKKCS